MNFYDEAIEAKHNYQNQLTGQQLSLRKMIISGTLKEIEGNVDLKHLYESDINALREADPYFWDNRITQLVIASGQQLPETITFDDSWMLGKAGFWWFGRMSPLIGLSTEEKKYYVSALLWHVESAGTLNIATLHYSHERKLEHLGAFSWRLNEPLSDALERLSSTESMSQVRYRPDLQLGQIAADKAREVVQLEAEHTGIIERLTEIREELERRREYVSTADKNIVVDPDRAAKAEEEVAKWNEVLTTRRVQWKEASANALKSFACGSLWLQQKIVITEQAHLERAARRRLARAAISTTCLVVHLRSKSYVRTTGEEEKNHVDWAWQWAVRGHWRNQPTNEGIKLVWIHPFIKGPEDKPLKPTAARVFAVTR